MALQIPNLDDRRFQDLVDEARRQIPRYCPRWTDHNLSDPGITLLELFAGMVETLIYRLNRVPDKSYIAFLDLMGVQLQPPTAAQVGLTFWLSSALGGPDAAPVIVPADTEVATPEGAGGRSISFSTDAEVAIKAPQPVACLASPDDLHFRAISDVLRPDNPEALPVFGETPRPGECFALVDAVDLSGLVVELTLSGPIQGFGVNPLDPPLRWQAWCDAGWRDAEIELDETGGLNKEGRVVLHLPPAMARRERGGADGYWLRCVFVAPREGQKGYAASPRLQTLTAATLGARIEATHSTTVIGEIVGRSSGEPGQSFRLEQAPVLPRRDGEGLELLEGASWEPWEEREHFAATGPADRHYLLDGVSGELRLGPRVREPDGSERQYGRTPPAGSMLRMARYRTGGGVEGNVGAGTLTVLKSALPYVDRVVNRRDAAGGLDAEDLERARLRAPQMLRTSDRAVTSEDYEYLAVAAGAGVRRARCLQPGATGAAGRPPAGTVRVLLVPAVEPASGRIARSQLDLTERRAMVAGVRAYLDERRLIGTVLELGEPSYVEVSVEARIKARAAADAAAVAREAHARLDAFLNPLVGGPNSSGWPFGRGLYISEIFSVLQGCAGVEYLEQVIVRRGAERAAVAFVELPPDGLILSGEHSITMI